MNFIQLTVNIFYSFIILLMIAVKALSVIIHSIWIILISLYICRMGFC